MHVKFISYLLIASLLLSFTGCKKASVAEESTIANETDVDSTKIMLDQLQNNTFYIYHPDGSIEPVYFGYASFNYGDTNIGNNRIMWFKDDVDNVPTLMTGAGDKLIFYSHDILSEKFNFERFRDLGYSVGIGGLRRTDTGRYSLSTEAKSNTTYPGSDADELLLLKNKEILFEKMGDTSFAGDDLDNNGTIDKIIKVSDYGTIEIPQTFEKKTYHFEVYEGTIKHEYDFVANIWILGSMSREQSADYAFIADNLIEIKVPDSFQTGYYNSNGTGVFRYVKGDHYNIDNHESFNYSPASGTYAEDRDPYTVSEEKKKVTSKFTLANQSNINIQISFEYTEGYQDNGEIGAVLVLPDGRSANFLTIDGLLQLSLNDAIPGNYVVEYINIDPNTTTPKITVTAS